VGGAWLTYTHTRIAGGVLAGITLLLLLGAVVSLWRRSILDGVLGVLISAGLGTVAAWLYSAGSVAGMTHNFFITLEVTPRILGIASLVAAGLGILASAFPSLAVARMSVVNGLKTLD
jgi:hypothetical protein